MTNEFTEYMIRDYKEFVNESTLYVFTCSQSYTSVAPGPPCLVEGLLGRAVGDRMSRGVLGRGVGDLLGRGVGEL